MELKKLEIKNFRGLKNYEIEFNRKLNILEGKNGSGKTTILESILWLFTGETVAFGNNGSLNKNINNDEEIAVKGILYNGDIIERNSQGFTKNGEIIRTILNNYSLYNLSLEKILMDYNEIQYIQGAKLRNILFNSLDINIEQILKKYDIKEEDLIHKYKFSIEKNLEIIKQNENTIKELESNFEADKLEELNNLREEREKILKNYSDEEYEKKVDLKSINERLQNISKIINAKQNAVDSEILSLKNEFETDKLDLTKEIEDLNYKILECNWRIENADNQLAIKNDNIKRCCPECGYVLNQDEVTQEEERIKHYTERKQIALEELNNYNTKLKENQNKLEELNNKLNELFEKLQHSNYASEILELQDELDSLISQKTDYYNSFIEEKNNKLREVKSKLKDLIKYEDIYNQIGLLKQQNEFFRKENEKFEKTQEKVEAFYQDKTFKDKLNKAFKELDFEWDQYYDRCRITFKNVFYNNVNDGDKKVIGIIFAEDLKKVLKVENLPVIFDRLNDLDTDNLEKILKITNSQIITTRVSDEEKIIIKEN